MDSLITLNSFGKWNIKFSESFSGKNFSLSCFHQIRIKIKKLNVNKNVIIKLMDRFILNQGFEWISFYQSSFP
ncbi:hypothetical protein AMR47_04075 [Leptospira interrogans]|nr:hypothetical protein AMR47_04075 [Leptospira interrogans]